VLNKYSEVEKAQLADALGCDVALLDTRLKGFLAAAEEEYVRMMLGQHVYSRGQDMKIYRLCLLIKHAFDGRLPTEGRISALFQTTNAESRSLLRAVRAKYQYELRQAIQDSMRETLHEAKRDDDDDTGTWRVVCDSENLVDSLNEVVARHDGALPRIRKSTGTAGEYEIAASTYGELSKLLS
jgi:hypothetical protein